MINQTYPCEEINLNTDIDAIAVTITLPHINITICNMYIPNQKEFTLSDIEHIIHLFPNPFIIVGDFNSHSETWRSYKTDSRGKIIEELLTNYLIIILNNGKPTKTNPSNGLTIQP
jgi:hypothetical protein